MSDHNHYETFSGSVALLPWLLLVLLFEGAAIYLGNELAINAHSFDVLSDVLAFLIVIVGAAFSGLLDDRGRSHRETHREQRGIAVINLLVLWFGAALVFWKSLLSFGEPVATVSLQDWWVIVGPALAVVVYWQVGKKLHQFSPNDLTVQSLDTHVKADVFVSVLALVLTVLNLTVGRSFINPVGGIIMSLTLFYISIELLRQVVKREIKQ